MTEWTLATHSPLLDALDGSVRRARFTITPPTPKALEDEPRLLVGAATVDITPPPGMPKAGYSSNAHTGSAFRTRLRATITHLRCGTSSIAIVQCDLLGGSSVVQHLVARDIAESTDVPLAGLWIGATHTHAGPGQFLGTDFYNKFASNKGGFDPAYTQFLASQIAQGVRRAVAERREGKAALGSTPVWGLTRNRSLDPHVQNETVADKRTEPQRKFVSVDPTLHLLRVDTIEADGRTRPLSAAVTFAIHGTGVSQHADEYHSDVWGFLTDELGHRVLRETGTRPHVGAMEGLHADVAPALRPGQAGFVEAERIGRSIGAEAASLHARMTDDLVDLGTDRENDGIELPDQPAVGAALAAGAKENLTPVIHRFPPFKAGHPRRRPTGPQAEKHVLGSRRLQPFFLPKKMFPRVLSVHVLRIGDAAFVGLPFELTTETGRRIGAAVHDATAAEGIGRVVVSSVVNEYSGYVTTPEEYRRQFYEGGHTLYGPNTQPFLSAHAVRLAGEVARSGLVHAPLTERRYSLAVHRYLAEDTSSGVTRSAPREATFHDPDATHNGYWEARWVDDSPGALHWHEPLVRVEASDDGTTWHPATAHDRVVDDQWWALEIRHVGPHPSGGHDYLVRWWDPSFAAGRRHRFVLLANADRPEVAGDPFD